MIRVKIRQYGLFVGKILLSMLIVSQMALAAKQVLLITEVLVDFDNGTLTIRGVNFDNGSTPTVTLPVLALFLCQEEPASQSPCSSYIRSYS